MKILLAFDKFKGALTAGDACRIAGGAIRRVYPDAVVDEAPLTDGGEGFCSILTEAAGGRMDFHEVSDPLGRPVSAPIGWVTGSGLTDEVCSRINAGPEEKIAVIEMASASGLPLLSFSERDPWKTSSRGTGELLLQAAEEGADRILLGVGGSATNDCGVGALESMGVRFLNRKGDCIGRMIPSRFSQVDSINLESSISLPPVVIASDVQSPLLGELGATQVFGPQKGLLEVDEMEAVFERMALLLASSSRLTPDAAAPGMGAAGGIAYGLASLTTVQVVPGFSLVSEWMGLRLKLREADWVITGEGRMDRSSLSGKGPVALLREAAQSGARLVVIAGAFEEGVPEALQSEIGDCSCRPLSLPGWTLEESLRRASSRLAETMEAWAGEELSQ